MRFHINKQSEITAHEQLREQIIFLISTGQLPIGEEMPSVRALSRQLGISLNTVSKVYSELVRGCWLIGRPGAHHIVVESKEANRASPPVADLDDLINRTLSLAHAHGYSLQQLAARIRERLLDQPPDHFLIVEPEPKMGEILRAEIRERIGYAPPSCGIRLLQQNPALGIGAVLITPTYLVDRLGFVAPHRRRILSVSYTPLDEVMATISKLARPSMIGILSVSGAGLKTLSCMTAPAIGKQHSLHLFLMERLDSEQSDQVRFRRYEIEEYHPENILKPASDGKTSASVVPKLILEEPNGDNAVLAADLRCMDILFCDSVAYSFTDHPGRIKYQLLSRYSLDRIAAEAANLAGEGVQTPPSAS